MKNCSIPYQRPLDETDNDNDDFVVLEEFGGQVTEDIPDVEGFEGQ